MSETCERCGRATPVDCCLSARDCPPEWEHCHGSGCYRIGYEREKARAGQAEAELTALRAGIDADVDRWDRLHERIDAAEAACAAMREVLEMALRCARCHGTGQYEPTCSRCDDSTEDHECPGPRKCEFCDGTGRLSASSKHAAMGLAMRGSDVAAALASDVGAVLLAEVERLTEDWSACDEERQRLLLRGDRAEADRDRLLGVLRGLPEWLNSEVFESETLNDELANALRAHLLANGVEEDK